MRTAIRDNWVCDCGMGNKYGVGGLLGAVIFKDHVFDRSVSLMRSLRRLRWWRGFTCLWLCVRWFVDLWLWLRQGLCSVGFVEHGQAPTR